MASDQPLFSIIIPTYNRATSIEQTLESCFDQSLGDFELVVVDDGSSDNTPEVLASIEDSRLTVIRQENAGPAAARNRGMQAAKGQFIAFLDSDDSWYPRFLELVEKTHQQHAENNTVIYGQIIVDRGVGRYWIKPDRPMHQDEDIYDYLYVHGGFIQTSTMVIPQVLASKVRWDESVTFGDNDQFAIDLWRAGASFHMLPLPMTLYADAMSPDALSQLPIFSGDSTRYTNFFTWMNSQKEVMSDMAWTGFRARFESVGLARTAPLQSISLLLQAWKIGAMRPGGILRQMLQNFAPRLYRRLTDHYVRWRGVALQNIKTSW